MTTTQKGLKKNKSEIGFGAGKNKKSATKYSPKIKMTQSEAWAIYNSLSNLGDHEQAYNKLRAELPTRNHLTHWLGQIGHRLEVKSGKGKDREQFLREIVEKLWKRSRELRPEIDQELKGQVMEKTEFENGNLQVPDEESLIEESRFTGDLEEQRTMVSENDPVDPQTPGEENVQEIGKIQGYWIAIMKIYADCAVQRSEEGVFHVLGRNFESSGDLSWWLWKIGHADKCKYTKYRDIVDAIRKVAALLHKDLRKDVGLPVDRWNY